MESWSILLGWPSIVLALGLSAVGILRRESVWLFVGAGLLLPISLYLAGNPRFGGLGLALPFLVAGAGIAVKRGRIQTALALHLPVVAVLGYLAVLVVTQ